MTKEIEIGQPTGFVAGHLLYGVGQFRVTAIYHTVGDQMLDDGTLIGWRHSYERAKRAAEKARDLAVVDAKQQEAHQQLREWQESKACP